MPADLVTGVFVTVFKRKGSSQDFSKYRFICLLNHAFKLMSCYLLSQFVSLSEAVQPETQAGFRKHRSTRDNIFLLAEVMDEVMRKGMSRVVTFIDFVSAFDTVSHHFLDEAMAEVEAELIEQGRHDEVPKLRKCRAMFRAIYSEANACVRVTNSAGEKLHSDAFPIDRGVVQGDIFSPVAFILALAVVMQRHGGGSANNSDEDSDARDSEEGSVTSELLLLIRELLYADDAALIDLERSQADERVNRLAEGAMVDADMEISIPKTEVMHVQEQAEMGAPGEAEYEELEEKGVLKHKCEYCGIGFDTKQGRNQHVTTCGLASREVHSEEFEVEAVTDARGSPGHRFYKVKWRGYSGDESTWEPWRHLINADNAVSKFWAGSALNKESCIKVDGESRCKWCCKEYTGPYAERSLKCHYTRGCDCEPKSRVGTRAEKAAKRQMKKSAQQQRGAVLLQGVQLQNVYEFKYLGYWFTADADRRHSVVVSMANAKARFGQLWQIWGSSVFPLSAKVKLFGAAVVSVLVYGSEVWVMDEALTASLKGWCAKCMVRVTGRTHKEECTDPTYPLIAVIRQRRLKWLGHVLRAKESSLVRKAVVGLVVDCIEGNRQAAGTIVMDAPPHSSIEDLVEIAENKELWNSLVNVLHPNIRKKRKNGSIDVVAASSYIASMEADLLFRG